MRAASYAKRFAAKEACAKVDAVMEERSLGEAGALVVTPLFHVTANNCVLHPCTLAGGKIVFMYKWDAGRALELIERERVNTFSGVPTMSRGFFFSLSR